MGIIEGAVRLFVQTETQLLLTKLHGVFVQRQWMADPDPLKHVPPHDVLPCHIWSFCVKGCRRKYS